MVQTAFLASSTNTGAIPPSTHFFTQAAPEPACLAPHIESDIQPLILDESAALAESAVRAETTNRNARTRFTRNLQGIGKSRTGTIMLPHAPFRQHLPFSGLRSEERRVGKGCR